MINHFFQVLFVMSCATPLGAGAEPYVQKSDSR